MIRANHIEIGHKFLLWKQINFTKTIKKAAIKAAFKYQLCRGGVGITTGNYLTAFKEVSAISLASAA